MPVQPTVRRSVRMLRILILLAFTAALVPTADAVPFDVIAASPGLGALQPQQATLRVLHSSEELEDLWRSLGRNLAPPTVEFRRHRLIAYFAGLRPTTGYRLSVESVDIRGGTMLLGLMETTPGTCCVTTGTSTSPDVWLTTLPWRGPVDVLVRRVPNASCCP